jgi:hypothetical protein
MLCTWIPGRVDYILEMEHSGCVIENPTGQGEEGGEPKDRQALQGFSDVEMMRGSHTG